jgi:hypothetical protein
MNDFGASDAEFCHQPNVSGTPMTATGYVKRPAVVEQSNRPRACDNSRAVRFRRRPPCGLSRRSGVIHAMRISGGHTVRPTRPLLRPTSPSGEVGLHARTGGLAPFRFQLPTPNFQLPATNFQLPATSYQLPATSYQLPASLSRTGGLAPFRFHGTSREYL